MSRDEETGARCTAPASPPARSCVIILRPISRSPAQPGLIAGAGGQGPVGGGPPATSTATRVRVIRLSRRPYTPACLRVPHPRIASRTPNLTADRNGLPVAHTQLSNPPCSRCRRFQEFKMHMLRHANSGSGRFVWRCSFKLSACVLWVQYVSKEGRAIVCTDQVIRM